MANGKTNKSKPMLLFSFSLLWTLMQVEKCLAVSGCSSRELPSLSSGNYLCQFCAYPLFLKLCVFLFLGLLPQYGRAHHPVVFFRKVACEVNSLSNSKRERISRPRPISCKLTSWKVLTSFKAWFEEGMLVFQAINSDHHWHLDPHSSIIPGQGLVLY